MNEMKFFVIERDGKYWSCGGKYWLNRGAAHCLNLEAAKRIAAKIPGARIMGSLDQVAVEEGNRLAGLPGADAPAPAPVAVSDAELEKFRADLDALLAAHQQDQCPAMAQVAPSFVVLEVGPRYVRVVHCEGLDRKNPGNRSAYCFIERSSGDILKAAGWKAPAKHARGNIRIGGPLDWWHDALSPYGAAYLR